MIKEEKKLVEYLRILTQWDFGFSRTEILNCIEQFVTENDIKTPFKNNRLGEDRFLNFKKRYGLSIKKQSVEYARKKMTDPFIVSQYFDLLKEELDKLMGIRDC